MPYFFALTIVAVSAVTLAFVGKSRRPATPFEPRYEEALEDCSGALYFYCQLCTGTLPVCDRCFPMD